MKLISVHVQNYRSILDSNPVEIGGITCLVGKNEAGKTAFLKALEGLRSVDPTYTEYAKTENYPRRYLSDYSSRHEEDEAKVIETVWSMDDSDYAVLAKEFGPEAVTGRQFTVSKTYATTASTWSVPIDEKKAIEKLKADAGIGDLDNEPIKDAVFAPTIASRLTALETRSAAQTKLLEKIKTFRKERPILRAIDLLDARTPKFLYFSHYDRMSGEIAINKLRQDKANGGIEEGDQVFLDFLEYAGTTLDDLTAATRFEELNAQCEAAANRITDQIFEYWTQNDQLEIEVRLDEGKPEDLAPFNSGTIARARVKNNLHRVSVPFSERSAGFIWFFSFLVKFAQIKKAQGNVIILLDEPGLTLHGTAQKDLLRFFKEELEPQHQLIYSTHSPFMVPADQLTSVRTVEDAVKTDARGRLSSDGTKVRSDVLTTDPQTNFPIFGAMGFEVTQGLLIAPNTLLVEGPGDILYLQALSKKLQSLKRKHLDPKWAICPAGGIDKVLPFVRLFYGNSLNVVVLTDFDRGQVKKLDLLYKTELLERERIILATEIAQQEEADIEDFFHPDFFAELLNQAYKLTGKNKLTSKKLIDADPSTERLVKKAEAYFRTLPDTIPMFGHYDPAYYLMTHPDLFEGEKSGLPETLDRFEEAFQRIARYA
jgi:energy-coupling factor transporter ATP-binding protein EcfA2